MYLAFKQPPASRPPLGTPVADDDSLVTQLAAANANAGANTYGGGAPPPSQSSYPGQQQPGGASAYPGQSSSQPSYGGGAQPQGGSSYPGQQQQVSSALLVKYTEYSLMMSSRHFAFMASVLLCHSSRHAI